MFTYVKEHREYLRREYRARVQRRPLYSQRAFARDLGLSPSSLTDYLKGNIRFSAGRIQQIGKSIGLTAEQCQHWIDLIDSQHSRDESAKSMAQVRVKARLQAQSHSLTMEQYTVISDWYHFAYLELIEMNSALYTDPKKAAQVLGIPVRTMKEGIQRLQAGGLLRVKDNGEFEVDSSTQIGEQIPSRAICNHHSQILKKIEKSMEVHPMERRVNTSAFVALPKSQVPKLIEELRSAAVRILEPHLQATQNQPKEELYCLSLHLFDVLSSASEVRK